MKEKLLQSNSIVLQPLIMPEYIYWPNLSATDGVAQESNFLFLFAWRGWIWT